MWRNASRPGFPRPGPSLRVKLLAVLLCLLAAGAAVIVTAGASALRGQLTRQAGDQLRAYVHQLTSHSFQLLGTARGAPPKAVPYAAAGTATGARAPGTAGTKGSPGAARMAGESSAARSADAPSMVVAGTGAFSIELRGPGGQLLLSVGPGTRPEQAVPAAFAPVPARAGLLRTVRGVGGIYLVIAEPMHVQARRLVFGYGADDFAVTSGRRHGEPATLVVGLRLAGIGQAVRRLALLAVAVSTAVILLTGGLAWAAIRFSLRPVSRAARTADAVAAGVGGDGVGGDGVGGGPGGDGLAQRVPGPAARGLAASLNSMLSRLDEQGTASASAETAARAATAEMVGRLESVAQELRRPISLLHGQAEHWTHRDRHRDRHRDGHGNGDADRALNQIAAHAARAEALLDEMDGVSPDRG